MKIRKLWSFLCVCSLVITAWNLVNAYGADTYEVQVQPTEQNPQMILNNTEGVTYQWYALGTENSAMVKEIPSEPIDGKYIGLPTHMFASEKDEVWTSEHNNVGVYFNAKAGDIIKVIPVGDCVDSAIIPNHGTVLDKNADGTYSCEIKNDNICHLAAEHDSYNGTVSAKFQLIRDGVAYPIISGANVWYDDVVYAVGNTATYENDCWVLNGNGISLLAFVNEGDIIQITPSTMDIAQIIVNSGSPKVYGDSYYCVAEYDGEYPIELVCDDECTVTVNVIRPTLGKALEGQNSNRLTEAEYGGFYACEATCPDGTKLVSNFIQMQYDILSQPTVFSPTVELNYEQGASYQWYLAGEMIEHMALYEGVEDCIGNYHEETGRWSDDDGLLRLYIPVVEGETIILTPESGADIYVDCYNAADDLAKQEDGSYVYPVEEDGRWTFEVTSEDAFELTVTKRIIGATEKLDGQNTKTLTEYEYMKSYCCQVTWATGEMVETVPVQMTAAIIQHPAVENLSLKVTFPELVKSYQWYTVNTQEMVVANYTHTLQEGKGYAKLYHGSFKDGKWCSEDAFFGFETVAEKGDTFTLTPVGDMKFSEENFGGMPNDVEYSFDNGAIICTIGEVDEFYMYLSAEEDFQFTAQLTKADGSVYEIQEYNYKENEFETSDGTGIFQDGIWTAEERKSKWRLSLELDVKEGDRVILLPSVGYGEYPAEWRREDGSYVQLQKIDGGYQYTVTKDEEGYVIFEHDTAFTAQVIVCRDEVDQVISGQTTNTLTEYVPDRYACVVEYQDGTKLVSYGVEIPEQEEPETDSETDSGTDDGPGTGSDNGDTGNEENNGWWGILLVIVVVLIVVAVVVFMRKKNSAK